MQNPAANRQGVSDAILCLSGSADSQQRSIIPTNSRTLCSGVIVLNHPMTNAFASDDIPES